MNRVLVTGAGGFVAGGLIPALQAAGHGVVAAGRARPAGLAEGVAWRRCELGESPPMAAEALAGIDAVVHLAALAQRHGPPAEIEIARVNVAGPAELAVQAAAAGVGRFVLVSSAAVYGERGGPDPFAEASPLAPREPYARSKAEAERGLRAVARDHGLEPCVVRPPLVYGPGAKDNFARLRDWALAGRPLPAACRRNRRSFVGLGNLADLLVLAATHPAAAGETFVAADGEDMATGELYARLCRAAGRRPRFWPVPVRLLRAGLRVAGRGGMSEALLGDFRLDAGKARRRLGWRPPWTVDDELARVVAAARGTGAAQ